MKRIRSISICLGILLVAVPATAEVAITPDVVYGHKDGMALVYDVFQGADTNGASRGAHRDRARNETLAFLTAQLATDRE